MFLLKHWKIITLILGVLSLAGALWAYGAQKYYEGYNKAVSELQAANLRDNIETHRETENVRRFENSLDNPALLRGLCDLGIMREREGCDE